MKPLTGKGKPFHSSLDKAAALLKRKVGTGQEFMKELQGLGGIKQAEIDERKLAALMGMPKMTHEQFLAELSNRPVPAIKEKVLGGNDRGPKDEAPYHGEYTLPGGENYREMLIKAPKGGEQFGGVGAHFGGEGNILASMRLKDRMTPEGQKLLHLEELQSDWHQQGREKGYKSDLPNLSEDEMTRREQLASKIRKGLATSAEIDEQNALRDRLSKIYNAVPDAPFKKNWEEMALKRLIHHAAEKGYHGIVVTPGKEQADRYSLAKHINELHLSGTNLVAYDHDGNEVIKQTGVTPEELPSIVGKEAAEKLLAQKPQGTLRSLTGQNLEVGGEGMKGFYDKKVPNILNAIGKKHGVKTQLHGHQLSRAPKNSMDVAHYPMGEDYISGRATWPEMLKANPELANKFQTPLHHFPITEDMRKDILTNGLPLYADGGIIRKAEGGNVQLSVEQMRQQLMAAGKNLPDLTQIGAQEAPSMPVKNFIPVNNGATGPMPMGGVDMSPQQRGQQMLPASLMQPQQPQGEQGQPSPLGSTGSPPPQGGSNILQMTQQGQALNAMKPPQQPMPQMAVGGPVPVMNHPFQAAGDRPLPFMAKDGGSDNAPMNNDYSDNGATDFSIDNIQQLNGGGGVQGYASKGYVHHTDINPNPEVGKRFVAEQLPGLMPEHPVDMNELYNQKASLQLRPWDSTSRHVKVSNVSGHDLENPLITEGGQGFARDIELNKEGIAGGSGRDIQKRIQSRANTAHEENIKQGGRGHTYDIIANMDKLAPLFTNMPLHIQLDLLRQANLSPKEMQHIEHRTRTKKVQGKTPFTKMLSLDNPELMKQLKESGALRKALSTELASKTNQKRLDYNLEDALAAVTDPHIHAAPAGYAGNTFIANVPYAGLGPSRHTTYDTSGYGEYAGKGAQVPAELYMADTFERVSRELQKQYPKAGASAIRAMTIGALQTRGGNVSQMVNDRVMKNIERFHEGVKKGNIQNPNDLYGVLGHFYKEYGGYKDGGDVKKKKVTDNLDTMRLALTRNTKKKAAK